MNIYLVIFITLVAALIASFSQTLYKRAMTKRLIGLRDILGMFLKKWVLLGLGGYMISLVVYLFALSNAPLSVVYPTFASTFIFITILSAFALNEKIGRLRAIGTLIVFLGIFIIALTL